MTALGVDDIQQRSSSSAELFIDGGLLPFFFIILNHFDLFYFMFFSLFYAAFLPLFLALSVWLHTHTHSHTQIDTANSHGEKKNMHYPQLCCYHGPPLLEPSPKEFIYCLFQLVLRLSGW